MVKILTLLFVEHFLGQREAALSCILHDDEHRILTSLLAWLARLAWLSRLALRLAARRGCRVWRGRRVGRAVRISASLVRPRGGGACGTGASGAGGGVRSQIIELPRWQEFLNFVEELAVVFHHFLGELADLRVLRLLRGKLAELDFLVVANGQHGRDLPIDLLTHAALAPFGIAGILILDLALCARLSADLRARCGGIAFLSGAVLTFSLALGRGSRRRLRLRRPWRTLPIHASKSCSISFSHPEEKQLRQTSAARHELSQEQQKMFRRKGRPYRLVWQFTRRNWLLFSGRGNPTANDDSGTSQVKALRSICRVSVCSERINASSRGRRLGKPSYGSNELNELFSTFRVAGGLVSAGRTHSRHAGGFSYISNVVAAKRRRLAFCGSQPE
jgi:hypothetical protein